MRTSVSALLALLLLAIAIRAEDTPAKGKVVAVDLFKNGLAVVKCEVTLGKAGTYLLADVPQPVHGTFWAESTAVVETAVKMRDIEVPAAEAAPGDPQDDFAGKKVTITLKGANRSPVVGTMLKLKPAKGDGTPVAHGRFLVVQTGKGRTYVDAAEVSSIEAEDAGDKVTRRQPRMLLTLKETDKAETKVTLHYLTHGMAWSPSYRLDISDPKTLTLEQHAVVKNELADLDGVEVRLISGFPSVQFAHVRSLLSPGTTLASFFSELDSGPRRRYADTASNSVQGQWVQGQGFNPFVPSGAALGAIPTGEGVDLHYQPIGQRSLAVGDTLSLTVAKGKAEYERVVEWVVPDNRDEYGYHDRNGRRDDENDSAWDSLKFKNPLKFPMTTAPATVTANGAFNGQRTSYWVNAGEETVLRVEKALSVRTRATENEVADGNREVVWVGGRQYRRSTVSGELAVSNNRKETVPLIIRRRFSGELVKADSDPKASLHAEGVYSVNKRNELDWNLTLKGGETKTLKYSYTVLVGN